jgi:hypothetical protein
MPTPTKRFPFLMWGDLVEARRPVLRRALAGYRAHECMYAWVYLTEYLAHRRLLDRLPALPAETRRDLLKQMDHGLWSALDRSAIDPHFQLSASMFESVAAMACIAAQSGDTEPDFVELGSTFFTSKTRFEIVDAVARERFTDWPGLRPRWLGIDNSRFMHDTTRALHGGEAVSLYEDYRLAPKPQRYGVFLSRFVASYAFQTSMEFGAYLADRFRAALVEDAYSTTIDDVPVFNHGQAETFFSIPALFGLLEQAGFTCYVLDSYPDFPAGAAPCHVIRYLALRGGPVGTTLRTYLEGLGFPPPREPAAAATLLQTLNDAVTPRTWRTVKKAKEESPVWGRTHVPVNRGGLLGAAQAAKSSLLRSVANRAWRRYRFSGPLAVREIDRALRDEKP